MAWKLYDFVSYHFPPYNQRIQIVKEGKKRRLVINGAKLEDAGKITAKTNADETSCNLGVKSKHIETYFLEHFKNHLNLVSRSKTFRVF